MFDRESIIKLLKQQAELLGHPPSKAWWDKRGPRPSVPTIRKVFGTWRNALLAAGLKPGPQNVVTEQELIDDINRVAQELGRSPKITDYHKLGKYTSIQYHGGWKYLVAKAGFRSYYDISKDELIQAVKDVAIDLGRTPLYIEFCKHRLGYSSLIVYKYYSGYDELLTDADLHPPERLGGGRILTDQDMIDEVLQVANQIGHVPSQLEFTELSSSSAGTAVYKFGSYNKFLEAAGLDIRKCRTNPWTRSEIAESIQRYFREYHKPVTHDACDKTSFLPGARTITNEFGSIRKARQYSGIPEPIIIPKKSQIHCTDGHIVQSHGEYQVDEFLYSRNIPHEVQVYPTENRRWTCDFLAGDLWIEVDGFRNGRTGKYKKQFDEKIDFYKKEGFNYVILTPHLDGWQDQLLSHIAKASFVTS